MHGVLVAVGPNGEMITIVMAVTDSAMGRVPCVLTPSSKEVQYQSLWVLRGGVKGIVHVDATLLKYGITAMSVMSAIEIGGMPFDTYLTVGIDDLTGPSVGLPLALMFLGASPSTLSTGALASYGDVLQDLDASVEPIGGLLTKIEAASRNGTTLIVPADGLTDHIKRRVADDYGVTIYDYGDFVMNVGVLELEGTAIAVKNVNQALNIAMFLKDSREARKHKLVRGVSKRNRGPIEPAEAATNKYMRHGKYGQATNLGSTRQL